MPDSLVDAVSVEVDIETYLYSVGEVFRAFRDQDSACISYGVLSAGRRWFVKHSDHPQGLASLERAYNLNTAVRHEAMPRLQAGSKRLTVSRWCTIGCPENFCLREVSIQPSNCEPT